MDSQRVAHLLLFVCCSSCGGTSAKPQHIDSGLLDAGHDAGGTELTGFLRSQGTRILDARGNAVFLKGVSLGNQVWSNTALPNDHSEVDFQRLATMGANSTRFLLNYVTFEDDSAPFVYKQTGWDWIDQNVAWARAHNVALILNMHVPQGGFQSNGDGAALWSDASNQDRLIALWTAIASRYRDEPAIAAYDILNEPQPLAGRAQWQDLAARVVAGIRTADANHLVLIERTNAVAGNYGSDSDMNLFTLSDSNIAYEFHFYEPQDYAFQLQPWNNTPDGGSYPDETKRRNKAGLAEMMAPYLAWGKNHNVALYLGEFGLYKACFTNDKGGLTWVGDVYDVATAAESRVAGLSYHQYHEDGFALYYGSSGPVDPSNANQPLIDLLTAKFHATP